MSSLQATMNFPTPVARLRMAEAIATLQAASPTGISTKGYSDGPRG
jgi:hypothetical protein